ncbi:MAG: DUF255 domain-containing protein [Chitinophagaceae bacterium]|nr:MAG: DUF255 domain-containing protein [Chitinophagaceae bacterium]
MMKKLFLMLLVLPIITSAQENVGINFLKDKSWADAIALAKAENKLIFVDVYTDWCGPCKVMDKEVFPKKNVGDKFNASFINYKLDAEKGEGPVIAKRYVVKSYPNYLFINGEGTLVYRSTSSMSAAEFLGVAKNALIEAQQDQTVVQLDLHYTKNKTDKTFMYTYLSRRTALRLDNADLLDEYITLLNEDERGEIKNLQLILDNGMFLAKSLQLGISLETLKKHKDKFGLLTQSYKESLSGIEHTAIATTLKIAIAKKDEKLLAEVLSLKKPAKISPFNNKENTQQAYYLGTRQHEKYKNLAKLYANEFLLKFSLDTLAKWDNQTYAAQVKYYKNQEYKGNIDEATEQYRHSHTIQLTNAIHEIAKNFTSITATPEELKLAIKWLDYTGQITSKDTVYYVNVIPAYAQTYAILHYKLGNKKLAIAKMEEVIKQLNNPQATAYFTPFINKMKANEEL